MDINYYITEEFKEKSIEEKLDILEKEYRNRIILGKKLFLAKDKDNKKKLTEELNKDKKTFSKLFPKLELEVQLSIFNSLIHECNLKIASLILGINSKHWSEKFRGMGLPYSKVKRGFYPIDLSPATEEIKEDIKETETTKEPIKEVSKTANTLVETSFKFYYSPCGELKKMGGQVDMEVYKKFEAICNKYNLINVSGHLSNALALYIKELTK